MDLVNAERSSPAAVQQTSLCFPSYITPYNKVNLFPLWRGEYKVYTVFIYYDVAYIDMEQSAYFCSLE